MEDRLFMGLDLAYDSGSEFVSNFLFFRHSCRLSSLYYIHFTLDYHTEDNEQTKHTNQTLDQYLCVYCNYQKNN